MGRITSGAKIVGKNIYFYALLYCIGIIGIAVITITRYELIAHRLEIDSWVEVMFLLGTLYSLPILALSFIGKINRSLAKIVASIISIIVLIVYWISTGTAEELITDIRTFLMPALAMFFLYSAIQSIITIWQRKRD